MSNENTSGVHVWLVLWKAWRAMEAYDKRSIASLDICLSDFAVLEILLNKGPHPVNTIGKRVMLTSGSITTAVDRLEERGLVRREQSAEDRRVFIVDLTAKGRRFIERAFEGHKETMERAAGVLTQREREQLLPLLRKLGKGVEGLLSEAS